MSGSRRDICPLLSAGSKRNVECIEWKCAWWVHIRPSSDIRDEINECAIKRIAKKRK